VRDGAQPETGPEEGIQALRAIRDAVETWAPARL
jgi:hypothetical protein